MLKIRLFRMGKKKQPRYRLVVAEHTAPVQGKFLTILGSYNPFTKEINLDKKKALEWMNKGAKPSNTVAKLLKKEGLKHKAIVIKKFKAKPKAKKEEKKKTEEKEIKQEAEIKEEITKQENHSETEKSSSESVPEKNQSETDSRKQESSS